MRMSLNGFDEEQGHNFLVEIGQRFVRITFFKKKEKKKKKEARHGKDKDK